MSQLAPSLDNDALLILSITVHSVVYSLMKLYSHTPFAKPATHVHWYAWNDTVVSTVESVHVAPFLHGLLLHSSTSMSQLPPKYVALVGLAMLSITVHSVVYSLMKSWPYASWLFFGFFRYSHTPFAKPATHV